jgi:hypothetical protein
MESTFGIKTQNISTVIYAIAAFLPFFIFQEKRYWVLYILVFSLVVALPWIALTISCYGIARIEDGNIIFTSFNAHKKPIVVALSAISSIAVSRSLYLKTWVILHKNQEIKFRLYMLPFEFKILYEDLISEGVNISLTNP